MTDQELRSLLLITFEYTYRHDAWSNPLDETLAGITASQAAWQPGPELMGIWDMVLHLAVWNRNIIERIETGESTHPKQGAWPLKLDELTEQKWELAKTELWESIDAVNDLIKTIPIAKIDASPHGFADLTCRFTHMSYHMGQIVKIRECQGW